ncbi:MAG: CHAT domain-containing protein [Cyanobacteria bacterium J06639_14]
MSNTDNSNSKTTGDLGRLRLPRLYRRLGFVLWGLGLAIVLATIPLSGITHATDESPMTPVAVFEHTEATQLLAAGHSLYDAGRYAEAIHVWQTAADRSAQGGDRTQQIMALNYLSSAHQALNQWSQAEQTTTQSLELLAQFPQTPALQAQALNTYANLQLHLGQAETALRIWEQAEDYYAQAEDAIGVLGSQINQSEALQSLGFYRRARERLESANQQLAMLPDSPVKVVGLRSLGKALQLIGDPRDSYNQMAEALAIAQRINATTELSATYFSIGKLATEVESADIALAYFVEAEEAALTPQDQLQAQLEQFSLYVKSQQQTLATGLSLRLFEQLQNQPASRTAIYSIVNFAHNLIQLSASPITHSELNQLLAQAVQFARDLQDPRAEAHALRQMGQLYIEAQQWSDAFDLTQKSLQVARSTQAADVISQSAWQLGRLLKQQKQTEAAADIYREAVDALQSLRGDLVAINQDFQFSYREQVEPVYRELVALLLDLKTPTALKQTLDVLEALQVAELDNFFREACLDLQANQIDQIDPTATVIYSIILPDRLATIYAKANEQLDVSEIPIEASTVQAFLHELLALLHPSADKPQRLQASQQLYDWLIRPAETKNLLTLDQPLVFVLDGLLRNIPMAALYDGQQYLIEKYPVALSPGLKLIQARSLDQENIHALVGGISEQRGQFTALPAVATEVKAITELVSSSQLLNDEFTREALSESVQTGDVDVVHLATHGQFSSDFSQTFLLTWDGVVNIRELSEMLQQRENGRNQAIELLTLSACETATGDERATLGLAGLAVRSGARATIATLWPIKDDVAAHLMTSFYRELRRPHTSKAEALRQAQLELLRKTDFEDPFFWSTYVLIGNWV